jgi:Lamin Tail Domain
MFTLRVPALFFMITLLFEQAPAQSPRRYDVVIDECFPDPTPAVGLPAFPFIELKNTSRVAYDLHNWKISNGNTSSPVKTAYILQPDSFVILCPAQAVDQYALFGPSIGLSAFPTLAKDNGLVELIGPAGQMIHVVTYEKSWYQNAVESDGGWSLEMIDTRNPCTGFQNWRASRDPLGGTPGRTNSVDAPNTDQRPPLLVRTYTTDSLHVFLVFDEPLDSLTAATPSNYEIDKGVGAPATATPLFPSLMQVELQLSKKLTIPNIYQLAVHRVTDCSGNEIGGFNTAKTGLAVIPDNRDIVINEILFNPPSYGYDYIELYNRSQHIVDLSHLYLASREMNGALKDPRQLSEHPLLFFPGEYYAITEDADWVLQNYYVQYPDRLLQIGELPSMPDDHGNIALLNQNGNIIDALEYDHSWHFSLLNTEEGVALERLNANGPTQDASNWNSAASTAGFGTPTYKNSQGSEGNFSGNELSVYPKIFSPDNYGNEDICFIKYQLPESGFLANIMIFDANGRTVRILAKNSTLSQEGSFKWDGLNDRQQRLPFGNYIVYVELFDGKGFVKKFKEVVTLASKL